MDMQTFEEIEACLDQQKWVLNFYQDCYAVFLLDQWVSKQNDGINIRDIKSSAYSKLLDKPVIKTLTSKNAVLDSSVFNQVWAPDIEPLVLTLGHWGKARSSCYHQTSRPGVNLVLQVNLNNKWNYALQTMLSMTANELFDCGHPISPTRTTTLGWIRLDLDFETNEVLIEEVQSDFVRWLYKLEQLAQKAKKEARNNFYFRRHRLTTEQVLNGLHHFNSTVMSDWQDALLWSALWFCDKELGMRNVYYHTYETGALLKGIHGRQPPKSLYTKLPKKFCFKLTDTAPQFLANNRQVKRRLKTQKQPAFFHLAA